MSSAGPWIARAGRSVLVLERRAGFGGAAVSERPFAGQDARLSRYAYLVSLFPRALARDLGIELPLADRDVAAFAPYDGKGLLVEQDAAGAATRASVRRFYARHYVPGNLVIAAAGNLRHDDLVEMVRARMDVGRRLGPRSTSVWNLRAPGRSPKPRASTW